MLDCSGREKTKKGKKVERDQSSSQPIYIAQNDWDQLELQHSLEQQQRQYCGEKKKNN